MVGKKNIYFSFILGCVSYQIVLGKPSAYLAMCRQVAKYENPQNTLRFSLVVFLKTFF